MKIKKTKYVLSNKGIVFRSFNQYSVNPEYGKAVCKTIFHNYKKRNNVIKVYNNFFRKLIEVVNNLENCENKKYKYRMVWEENSKQSSLKNLNPVLST